MRDIDDDDQFTPGKRVRLSTLGKERCPRIANQTGIIVGKATRSNAIRILLEGSKMPISLHPSYIEIR
jgi:hypothetical protein